MIEALLLFIIIYQKQGVTHHKYFSLFGVYNLVNLYLRVHLVDKSIYGIAGYYASLNKSNNYGYNN